MRKRVVGVEGDFRHLSLLPLMSGSRAHGLAPNWPASAPRPLACVTQVSNRLISTEYRLQ